MQGLWTLIESMSLSDRNKKWLSDKLIESTPARKQVRSAEDQRILDGFREALVEWNEVKAGRAKTYSFDESIEEIRQQLAAEGYECD